MFYLSSKTGNKHWIPLGILSNKIIHLFIFYQLLFSRNIYQKLGSVVSEEQRPLYNQRVEEITPNIRYCAYNIGGLPSDVTELMKLRSDAPGSDILAAKIDVSIMQQ